jgi:hypothetical protein
MPSGGGGEGGEGGGELGGGGGGGDSGGGSRNVPLNPNGSRSSGGGGGGGTRRGHGHGRWTGDRSSGGGGGDSGGPSDSGSPDVSSGGAGALGSFVSFLLWGALGIGAIFLILFIIREIGRRQKDAKIDPDEDVIGEEPAPVEAELAAPLDDAELLARAGKFAEAIHMLLLRTLAELARADGKVAAHLTSREILASIRLREGAREALTELVNVVEPTWFGDDVPGELDWQRCKAQFDRFVAAYRAGAAAPVKEAA